MLPDAETYEELRSRFEWRIPETYNIGDDVCDKWAALEPDKLALLYVGEDGSNTRVSFAQLRDESNRLANLLAAHGIDRGDRVGILLPQSPITAIAHIAAFKLGAISIPLFVLFGPEALEYRLKDSGAAAVITDAEGARKLAPSAARCQRSSMSGRPRAGRARSTLPRAWLASRPTSFPPRLARTIRRSSSTPPAPRGLRRAPCTPIACCWAICRAWR
jgi:acyl-CoA synthetase (AMP-forming)/AMP-acid ligase II